MLRREALANLSPQGRGGNLRRKLRGLLGPTHYLSLSFSLFCIVHIVFLIWLSIMDISDYFSSMVSSRARNTSWLSLYLKLILSCMFWYACTKYYNIKTLLFELLPQTTPRTFDVSAALGLP